LAHDKEVKEDMEVIELDLELLRAEDVAKMLRIGRTKAYEMMAAGELPVVRLGRCVRVPRRRLATWLGARTVGGDDGAEEVR
jgi:excisionase family DNA binding protein